MSETITLYRPVGPKELELIVASGYREFPPRLPEQAIFYPVLNEASSHSVKGPPLADLRALCPGSEVRWN
jgi:hypothetical protein